MHRLLALLAVLVLALVACGDGSESTTTAAATATTDAPVSTDAPAETTTTSPTMGPAGAVSMSADSGTVARFRIKEVLRGDDTTVVASNPEVSVDVLVDFDDPDASEIGVVTIVADQFRTDESRRDTTINRFILDTGDFPEITFTPTEVVGLADALDGGVAMVTGDLTIRDVTNPVTFELTIEEATAEGVTAEATAEVDRTDWDLNIPSVPFVASVDEMVSLELKLVLAP